MLGQLAALARPGARSRSPVAPERRPGVPGHDFVLGRASDRPGMPPAPARTRGCPGTLVVPGHERGCAGTTFCSGTEVRRARTLSAPGRRSPCPRTVLVMGRAPAQSSAAPRASTGEGASWGGRRAGTDCACAGVEGCSGMGLAPCWDAVRSRAARSACSYDACARTACGRVLGRGSHRNTGRGRVLRRRP